MTDTKAVVVGKARYFATGDLTLEEKALAIENHIFALEHMHVWYATQSAVAYWPRNRFFDFHGLDGNVWFVGMTKAYRQAHIAYARYRNFGKVGES